MALPENRRRILAGLVAAAFILRLAIVLALGITKPPESDSKEYDTYAWNLAQGRGYRGMTPDVADQDHLTAYRPPGTSVVWAGCFMVFGHRYDVLRVVDCLAGAATVALVYAISRRCFDASTAMVAAALYAVWPVALLFCSRLLAEPVGTLLFLAYLLLCLKLAESRTWRAAIGAGMLLGLTILTRPNPLFMIPLTGVWALWQFRRDRAVMVRGLAIPLIALATMTPWWVRNYVVFHKFIPLSTMGGSSLLQGNNRIVATDPDHYGYSIWDTKIPEYRDALRAPNDEVERDRLAKRFAIEWLKANPRKIPALLVNKVVRGWTPFLQEHSPRIYRLGTLFSWGPVLLLFLIGVVPTLIGFFKSENPGWILHLTLLASLALTLILFGELRYRYSVEPVCIIIAASVVAAAVRLATGRRADAAAQSDLAGPAVSNSCAT